MSPDGIFNYRKKFILQTSFERQIRYLRVRYHLIPLWHAIELLQKGEELPSHALSLTFDDGYQNIFTNAYPILKKYNVPATIFVTTDFVDQNVPLWPDRLEYAIGYGAEFQNRAQRVTEDSKLRALLKTLPEEEKERRLIQLEETQRAKLANFEGEAAPYAPLSWEKIREMKQNGISFGAHTRSHPILTKLSAEKAKQEIEESRDIVAIRVGSCSPIFAYPNGQPGDFDEGTEKLLRDAGFSAALTTIPGFNTLRTNHFSLRRITLDGTDDFATFLATVSGARALLTSMKVYAKGSRLF